MDKSGMLEAYGDVYAKIGWEGGTGIFSYGDPGTSFDPELNEAWSKASVAVNDFEDLLEKKIVDLGGNIEDYET